MKRYLIIVAILVGLVGLSAFLSRLSPDSYKHATVVMGGKLFDAQVSDTEALREQGLSGRSGLKQGQAMLFVFDEPGLVGFWMKDMRFPIDMLWLDAAGKVVSWKSNATPDSYPRSFLPTAPSKYVVELPAGTVESLGLRAGDSVTISGGK